MKKEMADALLDFYSKMLKPEFDALNRRLDEHEKRFSEVLSHLDAIYHRLSRVEDEQLVMNNRLSRIEMAISTGAQNHDLLAKQVKDLKQQMALLQTRLDSVEQQLSSPE